MIKISKKSGLIIKGDSLTVEAELSAIIHFMLVNEVLPKKNIEHAIEIAFKSETEIDEELNHNKNNFKKQLENILDELFD